MPEPTRVQRLFPAAQAANFRWLWAASTASSIALWTLLLGNAWVVHELSDSNMWVGIATFASMFPFFLSPIGGVVADRYESRTLLGVTRVGAILTTGVLLALALADALTVELVVLVALMQGIVRSAENPAEQALIPNVIVPGTLANAVTLQSATRLGSRAVGPLLAGPLLATIGVEGAYGIALLFALLAFFGAFRMQVASRGGVERLNDAFASLRVGLSAVRESAPMTAIFLLVVAHCSLTMSFDAMLPGFAHHDMHSPTMGFTVLTVAVGAGAFVGTFALAFLGGRRYGPLFFATALLSGLGPMALALTQPIPYAAVTAVVVGASQAMFMALAAVFLQELVDDAVRGRVVSLYLMSAGGIMAVANLGFGALADVVGVRLLLFVPAVVFIAIVGATALLGRYLRQLYMRGQPAPEAGAISPAG